MNMTIPLERLPRQDRAMRDHHLQEVLLEYLERMRGSTERGKFAEKCGFNASNLGNALDGGRTIPIEWALKVGAMQGAKASAVLGQLSILSAEIEAKKEAGVWHPRHQPKKRIRKTRANLTSVPASEQR